MSQKYWAAKTACGAAMVMDTGHTIIMEATTTLTDALLEDLDDLDDSGDEEEVEAPLNDDDDSKNDKEQKGKVGQGAGETRGFLESLSLQRHLATIGDQRQADSSNVHAGTKRKSPPKGHQERADYDLVVASNKHLAQIAEELTTAHGTLAKAYHAKFPELEELLPNLVQYKQAVRIIWNEMDLTKVNDGLNQILHSNQIITLSVAGSTTSGRPLSASELNQVDAAAKYMEALLDVQAQLAAYVEQSMEALAPSMCALIGPRVAAKLIGLAGGLGELTKIPSCNLQVLGQVKQTSASRAGLSTTSGGHQQPHVGVLIECDLVQQVPKAMHRKALKTVAAKLALAIRYDFSNVDTGRPRSSQTGKQLRQNLEAKFEKMQEQDKAPVLKALPKPDLEIKKRRGGRRIRRWKERFAETEMMKQANTRAFSAQQGEYGDDAMGRTMGLLDTADSGGNIRKTTEKRKMRQANTKASRKRAMDQARKAQNKDGLASSVAFSQTESMELVNPEANKDRVKEANRKWFKQNSGFQSALPRKDA